jgi:hypothetical protein
MVSRSESTPCESPTSVSFDAFCCALALSVPHKSSAPVPKSNILDFDKPSSISLSLLINLCTIHVQHKKNNLNTTSSRFGMQELEYADENTDPSLKSLVWPSV